jgi:hypothetical protein
MDTILLPHQINMSSIRYGAVKVLPSGGKSMYISHIDATGNSVPLMIQTPEMRSPFGLSRWDKTEKGSDGIEKESFKYDLLLGFDGKETRENLATFYDQIEKLDKKMVHDCMENSLNWLGKKYTSLEVIQELYTPMIRYSRDKNTGEINEKYAPTFKITVPFRDGKFQCNAYGPDKKEIDLSTINLQGARITAIIQCVGAWFVGRKFGVSFKVAQLKVMPRTNIPKFAFRDVEEAVEDEQEPVQALTNAVNDATIQSSDDGEESDDELNKK